MMTRENTDRRAFRRGVRAQLKANDSVDRYRYERHGNNGPAMPTPWRRAPLP